MPIFDNDIDKGDYMIGLYNVGKDSFDAVLFSDNRGRLREYRTYIKEVKEMFWDKMCLYIKDYIESFYKPIISKESVCIDVEYYDNDNKSRNRLEKWCGTIDEVFEKFNRANNKLKYINGCGYRFVDCENRDLYNVWCKIIPFGKSWELCYPTGLVD